ncbi:MAG: hypothetical protein K2X45_04740 [Phreatobacter sp.]|nr:hypothetical protein [Phreatobacter sp.]
MVAMNACSDPEKINGPKGRLTPPTYPARVIEPDEGEPVHVVVWCPWDEDVHWHGAAGGGGNRAAHCATDWHSPLLRTGYNLTIVGRAVAADEVIPPGLMVGARRLHQVLDQASGALRAVLLRYLLDVKAVHGSVISKRMPKGKAWIFGADGWLIEPRGRHSLEGHGFISLAASLYGVPPGVAAVRFLEAVSFDRLDAEAVFAVQSAIDAWVARGAPSRASR